MSQAGIMLSQKPGLRAQAETQGGTREAPWVHFSKHLFPEASWPCSGWGWELVFPPCNRWSLPWGGGSGL